MTKAIELQGNAGNPRSFPVFQALLKVRLEKGYDVVDVSLVTVHTLSAPGGEKKNGIKAQAVTP